MRDQLPMRDRVGVCGPRPYGRLQVARIFTFRPCRRRRDRMQRRGGTRHQRM